MGHKDPYEGITPDMAADMLNDGEALSERDRNQLAAIASQDRSQPHYSREQPDQAPR